MRNRLCDQLGIEFPIFAFTHCRDVAAAVSRAGGLGVLGIAGLTPEELEIELSWVDANVDGAPYGVDVLIPDTTAVMSGGKSVNDLLPEEHRRFLDDLLNRYGVPPLVDRTARPIPGLDPGQGAALVDQALRHPTVRLVASALGAPPPHLIEAAHRQDVMVAALVGTVHHAERQRDAGVDIIVAQGYEAGGHTGEITTMVLVPEVVDAVSPLPVLAAGGIARGRQLAAALALGAQGAWTGSVWLTTQEAETHPVVKEKFLAATSSSTVRSKSITGKPARQLRTAWTEAWDDPRSPGALPMPLQFSLIDEAHQRIHRSASSRPGAAELITGFVGQVVGSLNEVKSARQVVFEMVEEYIEVAQQMGSSLHED